MQRPPRRRKLRRCCDPPTRGRSVRRDTASRSEAGVIGRRRFVQGGPARGRRSLRRDALPAADCDPLGRSYLLHRLDPLAYANVVRPSTSLGGRFARRVRPGGRVSRGRAADDAADARRRPADAADDGPGRGRSAGDGVLGQSPRPHDPRRRRQRPADDLHDRQRRDPLRTHRRCGSAGGHCPRRRAALHHSGHHRHGRNLPDGDYPRNPPRVRGRGRPAGDFSPCGRLRRAVRGVRRPLRRRDRPGGAEALRVPLRRRGRPGRLV